MVSGIRAGALSPYLSAWWQDAQYFIYMSLPACPRMIPSGVLSSGRPLPSSAAPTGYPKPAVRIRNAIRVNIFFMGALIFNMGRGGLSLPYELIYILLPQR